MFLIFFLLALITIPTPSPAAEELDLRIPVVDMRDYFDPAAKDAFLETLYRAMHEVGFFAVRNTGVDRLAIERAYAQAQQFFKQDQEYKLLSYDIALNGQRGFVPGETAKKAGAKDCKEFYHMGREMALEDLARYDILPNIWPDQPGFRDEMTLLYNSLEEYVSFLFEAIVDAINLQANEHISADVLHAMTRNGQSLLRALYYPALTEEQMTQRPVYWAAPHTDIDLLAILPYATEKGLQVEVDGQWLTVVVPEDAFIVNIGDMLENLTNGLCRSARHRVKALEPGKERFSMVLFVHPTDSASLAPLPPCIELSGGKQLYAPGTRQEFLWERLLELGIAPALLEPYSKTGHTERQMAYGRESPQVVSLLIEKRLASDELLDALREKELKNSLDPSIIHRP